MTGRKALALVLVVTGIVGGGYLVLDWLDASRFLEDRAQAALNELVEAPYRIEVGRLEFSIFDAALRVEAMTVRPDPALADRAAQADRAGSPVFELELPAVQIEGLGRLAFLRGHALEAGSLRLEEPRLSVILRPGPGEDAEGDDRQGREDGGSVRTPHAVAAEALPSLAIEELRIERGSFSVTSAGEGERPSPRHSAEEITARIRNLVVDSASAADSTRVLLSDLVELTCGRYRFLSADGRYVFDLDSVRASAGEDSAPAGDRAEVGALRYGPTVSDPEFVSGLEYHEDRYIATASGISARGVDFRGAIDRRDVVARSVRADSLRVDVFSDKTLPEAPGFEPSRLPHELVRSLDRRLRIDTVRVTGGEIRYAERAAEGAERGHLTFEEIAIDVLNLTNDSIRMTGTSPAVANVSARLAGAGRIELILRYPLLSSGLTLGYRGRLEAMDARAFNSILPQVEGIRIESGTIDSLWFEAEAHRGLALGGLSAAYHDFRIQTVDPVGGGTGVLRDVESFLANLFMLESENVPGEGETLRAGEIRHRIRADDSFFHFLWVSVRSGLLSMVRG